MLIEIFLRENRIPLQVDIDISLHRRGAYLPRAGHLLGDTLEALDAVNHRDRGRQTRIGHRHKRFETLLSAGPTEMVNGGIGPHDDKARAVRTDEIGSLDEWQKRHLRIGDMPGEQQRKQKFQRHPEQRGINFQRAEAGAMHRQRENPHLNRLKRGVHEKNHDTDRIGKTAENADRINQPVKTDEMSHKTQNPAMEDRAAKGSRAL